jgi:hypothetical protein
VPRWNLCPACDLENSPDTNKRYTREEVGTHIKEAHAYWALCKGCNELMTKREYDEGKGWCGLCVYLCYDCLDEEKYGPPETWDWPSARTEAEDTNPDLEDPGPPPHWRDWLTPILYKGTSDREHGLLQWIRKMFS